MSHAPRLPHMLCPHCGGKAFARTGGKSSTLYREIYYHCREVLTCGHTFVVGMTTIRTVRQSAQPDPSIHLPISAYTRPPSDPIPANDDTPPPPTPATAMTG